ncbi:Zn-dependent protease with chaperone function [Lentzea waywayandensis]|uniref:Zn-dependent protease with chaperone function n=1 Tax=Lentzea waywayandensis TaxID=84724 RepID=A0A1I6F4P8_9PSEU|nr:M56 family metallopeptidase [Lentzea waywayandensis]SFR24864.1 Zn-dependent protease with chaperone function [Lentzea waywayandensis]
MTVAVSLLIGAALMSWLAPTVLARRVVNGGDPLVAIVAWLTSAAAVALAALGGVVLLLLPNHGFGEPLLAALDNCWSSVQHGTPPSVEAVSGVVGALLLLGLSARLVVGAVGSARRRARRRADQLAVLRIAARRDGETLWLEHGEPLAFSLTGRPGVIVATDGLAKQLTAPQVDAVLAHERAHLTGRHHLIVAIGEAMAGAFPFLPLFKLAPGMLRELVELVADAAAVRECGADAVRSALLKVSRHGAPGTALAMSGTSMDVRVERLLDGPAPASRRRQLFSCGLAGLTAMALPVLVAAGAMFAVVTVACPA